MLLLGCLAHFSKTPLDHVVAMDFTEEWEATNQPALGLVFFWAETVMPSSSHLNRATAGHDPKAMSVSMISSLQ